MHSAVSTNSPHKARKSDFINQSNKPGRFFLASNKWPIAVLEVLIGMSLLIGLGYLFQPQDPLLIGMDFPWIWLLPTIFALRYGALLGVLASLSLLFSWYFFYALPQGAELPVFFFSGGLAFIIIAGHFSDNWNQRLKKLQGKNDYLDSRLAAITTNHYLLRASHERLEKDLLAKPSTSREALSYLRELSNSHEQDKILPNIQTVLEFTALNCQIDTAAVFAYSSDTLHPQSVGWIGELFTLNPQDPLLRECVLRSELVHLKQTNNLQSDYLVCAPIMAVSGNLKGVLVVKHMSFLSLNFDNLQFLLVLLSYYADGIEQASIVRSVQKTIPQCPYEFALELGRLGHIYKTGKVESSLLALVFPQKDIAKSLFDNVKRKYRSLDVVWSFEAADVHVAIILMPLSNEKDVNGYLLRLEQNIKQQFSTDFLQAQVAIHRSDVSADAANDLKKLLDRCLE